MISKYFTGRFQPFGWPGNEVFNRVFYITRCLVFNRIVQCRNIAISFIQQVAEAQSPVESWKKTGQTLLYTSGKKTDFYTTLYKVQPCFNGIIYSFTSDGKISEDLKGCSEELTRMETGTAKISMENERQSISSIGYN